MFPLYHLPPNGSPPVYQGIFLPLAGRAAKPFCLSFFLHTPKGFHLHEIDPFRAEIALAFYRLAGRKTDAPGKKREKSFQVVSDFFSRHVSPLSAKPDEIQEILGYFLLHLMANAMMITAQAAHANITPNNGIGK